MEFLFSVLNRYQAASVKRSLRTANILARRRERAILIEIGKLREKV
jgi:hypothetical protein